MHYKDFEMKTSMFLHLLPACLLVEGISESQRLAIINLISGLSACPAGSNVEEKDICPYLLVQSLLFVKNLLKGVS